MKSLALAVAAFAALSTQTGGADVTFTAHEIATGLRGGYQVVVADLNKDGKPDIIALASGLPELLWFENHPNLVSAQTTKNCAASVATAR